MKKLTTAKKLHYLLEVGNLKLITNLEYTKSFTSETTEKNSTPEYWEEWQLLIKNPSEIYGLKFTPKPEYKNNFENIICKCKEISSKTITTLYECALCDEKACKHIHDN